MSASGLPSLAVYYIFILVHQKVIRVLLKRPSKLDAAFVVVYNEALLCTSLEKQAQAVYLSRYLSHTSCHIDFCQAICIATVQKALSMKRQQAATSVA